MVVCACSPRYLGGRGRRIALAWEAEVAVSEPRWRPCAADWQQCDSVSKKIREKSKGKLVLSLWKTVWRFLRKLQIKLLCDPEVPLLCRFPKKRRSASEGYLHLCFLLHCSPEPRFGISLAVQPQMNGERDVVCMHSGVQLSHNKSEGHVMEPEAMCEISQGQKVEHHKPKRVDVIEVKSGTEDTRG